MIRIIVRTDDIGAVVHGGAVAAYVSFKTFDVDLPDVEAYLNAKVTYAQRQVAGIEILPNGPNHD